MVIPDDEIRDIFTKLNEYCQNKESWDFNRGYDFETFDSSLKKLQERGIEVVVHTIFVCCI